MAGINCRSPSGWSSGDELATFLNISDKITKSDNQYYEAGAFSDVFKCQYHNGVGLVEVWHGHLSMGHYTLTTVQVAVKSFRFPFSLGEIRSDKDDSRNDRDQKSIRRELGIWRRLKHPNIVPFLGVAYGFGRPGQASLVSLWMVNGSLQSFLGQHGDQLTIAHRLQLLLDIANGLCYLHSFAPTPIIHGDLSSHNVLLDRNYNARLTDFGYTSMIGDMPEASLYLQMTTMKPGALRWAVPEHLLVGEEQTLQPTTQSIVWQATMGLKPKRPSSTPIEDQYWELIEHCWSSRDQEVVASTPEEPNPALRNSSAGTVSDDALRTNKETKCAGNHPQLFSLSGMKITALLANSKYKGLSNDTTARRQSGEIRLDLPANPQSGDKLNKRYSRDVA
ncbi:kinase-like domain-containing protein [Boletus edulis]|nr:kinase-like domain-containing protein [Boletus edulis]